MIRTAGIFGIFLGWVMPHPQAKSTCSVSVSIEPKKSISSSRDEESDDESWRTKDYEDALQCADFGRFQYILAMICGWANASDAVEILSVSFILSPAQCAIGLTSSEKGVLNSIVFDDDWWLFFGMCGRHKWT